MPSERPTLEHEKIIIEQDRPRGILSKSDRQFLLDPSYREELAAQSRRNVRSRIRERLRHAILDCYIVDEYLEARDRERVFSDVDGALEEGVHALLALLYRGADRDPETFASWLEGGLAHIELQSRSRLLVDSPAVDIDITPAQSVNPESVDEKIEAGRFEDLSEAEMRYLMWKLGKTFGGTESDNQLIRGLGEYAKRFEAQTLLGDAFEMIEETNPEK